MQSLKRQIEWFTRMQFAMLGAVALIGGMFYELGYRPQDVSMAALASQINKSREDLVVSQAEARRLPQVQAELNRLSEQLADVKKVPDSAQQGQFVSQITRIAEETNLSHFEYNLNSALNRKEQWTELPVTLSFDGQFASVFAFVRQVEDLPRLMRVTSMKVRGNPATGLVHVELAMNLYFTEG